jgi:hypothetical protein
MHTLQYNSGLQPGVREDILEDTRKYLNGVCMVDLKKKIFRDKH